MKIISADGNRSRLVLKAALAGVVLLTACHPMRGCAESTFTLSSESHLPKWFTLPVGLESSEVKVTLAYYPAPIVGSERLATVTLRNQHGQAIQEVVATLKGREPQTLKDYSGSGAIPYPSYEILTANGITEIVEHRRMEPIFYINEDAATRKRLGVAQ